jgi:hypothetical protein
MEGRARKCISVQELESVKFWQTMTFNCEDSSNHKQHHIISNSYIIIIQLRRFTHQYFRPYCSSAVAFT